MPIFVIFWLLHPERICKRSWN